MRRKNGADEHENLERWLLTYADLITLLLAFFIMMYTFSKQDAQKYNEVTAHLKSIFSGGSGIAKKGNLEGKLPVDLQMQIGSNAMIEERIKQEFREIADENGLKNNITVFTDARGVVVRIMDKAFYDEGKADLKQGAKNALNKIIPIMKGIKNHIRIEGHTDDTPISKGEFKSNWELSVRRATEVVRYIVEKGPIAPDRVSATGYAEYRPIVSNDTAENKALNRRVEIIIENTKQVL
ncbi:MAG TPA: flagellar motor protein MotB [Syntrophorhabdaceae bacterium]|jgi:chemotaxis protein MotB|nr:flagellar motor protein MotB [Syntrophorhabdaceae bacterium]MDI9559955.1 flagellar motor protein MotB [Pseudomonadota bacterium]OQC53215.1 MAG: Motility protein B [Deltaproteobacteria bacterium ADurb.Bin026]HNQ64083.1 flagellar motor protein MotB [Syntrophorhabdaceae bacterium]HOG40061.1 flagellar motor protein MotB [Syntrophorhabdaceae bacterium]